MNTLIAIFSNRLQAENAISELEVQGFNPKDMSIIMRDSENTEVHKNGNNFAEGATTGIASGGLLGGLAGLLIGIGAITIPGVGALLVAGPLAAALGLGGVAATTFSGAITGAFAGGLVGSLVGLGIPEHEAKNYQEKIKEGGILVAVPILMEDESKVRTILANFQADMVRVINTPQNIETPRTLEDENTYSSNAAYYSEVRPLPKENGEPSSTEKLSQKIRNWFK